MFSAITAAIWPYVLFAWHCFFAPIPTSSDGSQKARLDGFYQGQADVYDTTRNRLLRGRETMLSLCASHLAALLKSNGIPFSTTSKSARRQPLIWLDIGGGTGYNIEVMSRYVDLEAFDAIYLIDLCEPLLNVARRRFAKMGLKNVHVLCADATDFVIPDWTGQNAIDARGSISLITLSYSLSMIPSPFLLLDRLSLLLHPANGIIGVADFYTAPTPSPTFISSSPATSTAGSEALVNADAAQQSAILRPGGSGVISDGFHRKTPWLSRWFWQIWFDLDHVSLSPLRREYLEHKFGTVKSYNGRNNFFSSPFTKTGDQPKGLVGRMIKYIPFVRDLGLNIPYYIWLGRPIDAESATIKFRNAFEVEGGNLIGSASPTLSLPPSSPQSDSSLKHSQNDSISTPKIPKLEIGEPASRLAIMTNLPSSSLVTPLARDVIAPLSSFHYQVKKPYRLPYIESPVHSEFRTWIYSFTWEDPYVDITRLGLTPSDAMLVVTSAGDNALHYAASAAPGRIHCVDMNPCQNHLLELKLSAIQTLQWEDFFVLFGLGRTPRRFGSFEIMLDTILSPCLSSAAWQFWKSEKNESVFPLFDAGEFGSVASSTGATVKSTVGDLDATTASKIVFAQTESVETLDLSKASVGWVNGGFYSKGYSGHALNIAGALFGVSMMSKHTQAMCSANTIEEQATIWHKKLRPVMMNALTIALLKNPLFCWNALGVPLNQRKMVVEEYDEGVWEFVRDTLDPLASAWKFKDENYFYLLCLLGHYTIESCPLYLKKAGFAKLKENKNGELDALRLHTDSISNVLRGLSSGSLTRAVIMDHLDWFTEGSSGVTEEISLLHRALKPSGFVLWRSASKNPWYAKEFTRGGFAVERLSVRENGKAIDRVNMYASLWKATKA